MGFFTCWCSSPTITPVSDARCQHMNPQTEQSSNTASLQLPPHATLLAEAMSFSQCSNQAAAVAVSVPAPPNCIVSGTTGIHTPSRSSTPSCPASPTSPGVQPRCKSASSTRSPSAAGMLHAFIDLSAIPDDDQEHMLHTSEQSDIAIDHMMKALNTIRQFKSATSSKSGYGQVTGTRESHAGSRSQQQSRGSTAAQAFAEDQCITYDVDTEDEAPSRLASITGSVQQSRPSFRATSNSGSIHHPRTSLRGTGIISSTQQPRSSLRGTPCLVDEHDATDTRLHTDSIPGHSSSNLDLNTSISTPCRSRPAHITFATDTYSHAGTSSSSMPTGSDASHSLQPAISTPIDEDDLRGLIATEVDEGDDLTAAHSRPSITHNIRATTMPHNSTGRPISNPYAAASLPSADLESQPRRRTTSPSQMQHPSAPLSSPKGAGSAYSSNRRASTTTDGAPVRPSRLRQASHVQRDIDDELV